MKKVMLIHIASLIVSFLCIAFGIYMLINSEYLISGAFLFGGYAMGWDDWKNFLTKKK